MKVITSFPLDVNVRRLVVSDSDPLQSCPLFQDTSNINNNHCSQPVFTGNHGNNNMSYSRYTTSYCCYGFQQSSENTTGFAFRWRAAVMEDFNIICIKKPT